MEKERQQNEEIDERLLELTSLIEISKTLNSTLNLKSILDNVLRTPMGRMMINKGIILLEKGEREFSVETVKGMPRELLGKRITIIEHPDIPFLVDELQEEKYEWIDFFKRFGIKLLLPIMSKNKTLGFIGFGDKIIGGKYKEREMEFLLSISNLAATSIENGIIFEELREVNKKLDHSIQELNTLFDIGKELNSTLDSGKIVKLLGYALMGQMMVNKFALFFENDGTMELNYVKGIKELRFSTSKKNDREFLKDLCSIDKPYIVKEDSELLKDVYFRKYGFIAIIPMRIQDKTKGIICLGKRVDGKNYTDDNLEFLSTLGNQAMIALENARLFEETLEKQRLEEELAVAKQIQEQLLPKEFPDFPGFDIFAVNISSKQVGGDYFDIIRLDKNRLAIAIADVSGKSVPAALLMSNLQASLRALARAEISISDMISRINNMIFENTSPDKFITFFYGVIDGTTRKMKYCNAGHNPPFLVRKDDSHLLLDKGGLILGIMENLSYEEEEVRLFQGDVMLLYTDGVSEAMNVNDEEFGEQRIEEILKKNRNLSSDKLISKIISAVKEHCKNVPQSDDITMIAIKVI
ncbi:hypothetical protein DRQ09_07700 [candidate division KSB1 bacterium]|nr:MAG: hypothetical protein DRQ09_07700 [candidate division KSB1 bacterium]